mmetsp:Transcript_50578/g.122062  ORF Transcript_50578/g.122062 Transcript_50578/m.122062 type:complete len:329 (-) Transcript_50578:1474-2460(-)
MMQLTNTVTAKAYSSSSTWAKMIRSASPQNSMNDKGYVKYSRTFSSSEPKQPPGVFDGLKSYRIDTNNLLVKDDTRGTYPDPLYELQKAFTKRGISTEDGSRLNGAPWGFSLAELKTHEQLGGDSNTTETATAIVPSVRTIGFQRITRDGMDWLTKIPSSSDSVGAGDNEPSALGPVAICYSHGTYPPPDGGSCEQWRAEGIPIQLDSALAWHTAPRASLAQMVASQRCWANGRDRTVMYNDEDHYEFLKIVQQVHDDWNDPNQSLERHFDELRSSVQLLRLVPSRLELLETGPGQKMWTRIQWRRNEGSSDDEGSGGWYTPEKLLPY